MSPSGSSRSGTAGFARTPTSSSTPRKRLDVERAKSEGKMAVDLRIPERDDARGEGREPRRALRARNALHPAHLQLEKPPGGRLHGEDQRRTLGLRSGRRRAHERARHHRGPLALRSEGLPRTGSRFRASRPRSPIRSARRCIAAIRGPRPTSSSRRCRIGAAITGIAALGYFIGPSPDTSIEDYVNHVDHAVKVRGIDHVGLATDFEIRGIKAWATRETWYEPRLRSFKPDLQRALASLDRGPGRAGAVPQRRPRARAPRLLGGEHPEAPGRELAQVLPGDLQRVGGPQPSAISREPPPADIP